MEKFKNILRQVLSKKVLIIAIVLILIVVVILPSSYYFITINDAMWDDDEKGKSSSYTQNVKVSSSSESGGLTVDKDVIIGEALKGLNYTDEEIANLTDEEIIEKLDINKKLEKDPKVTSLDEVTQSEILWCLNDVYSKYLDKPEELEKLLNAEIVTQYPKMGASELDGIIEFERHKEDDTSVKLTYISKETFDSYINSNDESALDYFTLDDSGNVLIGTVNKQIYELTSDDEDVTISNLKDEGIDIIELDESYKRDDGTYYKIITTVSSKTIPYKNIIQQYTLPFQYLWCLLVIGEDKDFVLELADLAYNSEIIISIYDNTSTYEDENIFTYKKETRTDKYARLKVEDDYGVTGYPTERYWLAEDSPDAAEHYSSSFATDDYVIHDETYTVNYKVTNIVNNPIYDVTKADCWIVDYSKEYDYQSGNPTQNENSKNLEEEPVEYVSPYVYNEKTSKTSEEDSSLLEDEDAKKFANNIKSYIERSVNNSSATSYSSSRANINSKKTNYLNNIQSSIISGNQSEDVVVEDDGDEIEEEEEEEKIVIVNVDFVKYKNYDKRVERKLRTVNTVTSKNYVAGNVVDNLKIDKDSEEPNFVSILSKSEHYKARKFITGDYASWLYEVLEESLDTVNMIDLTKYLLNKVTGKNYGITEYSFEEYSSNSFSEVSIIYGNSFEEKVWFALIEAGYSEYAVAGAMGNFMQESGFRANNLQNSYESKFGMSDEEYTSAVDNGTYTNFVNDKAGYGLAQWTFWSIKEELLNFAKENGASIGDEDMQIKFLIKDLQEGNCSKWQNANSVEDACYYFEKEYERAGNPQMSNRLAYAQEIYDKYHGKTAPTAEIVSLTGTNKIKMQLLLQEAQRIANDDRYTYSQSNRNGEYQYDCSSLVSRLYLKFFEMAVPGSTSAYNSNYRVGPTSVVSLQPGDVLWRNGHVTLYIGNGLYVAAHGSKNYYASHPEEQISVYNDSPSKYTYVYRFITD